MTCIIFDKTGTLTLGNPSVNKTVLFDPNLSEKDFFKYSFSIQSLLTTIRFMGAAETGSEHPLSLAVINEAKRLGITQFPKVSNFQVCH